MALTWYFNPCCCNDFEDRQTDLPCYVQEAESVGVVRAPCATIVESSLKPCDPCKAEGLHRKPKLTCAWTVHSHVRFATNGFEEVEQPTLPALASDPDGARGSLSPVLDGIEEVTEVDLELRLVSTCTEDGLFTGVRTEGGLFTGVPGGEDPIRQMYIAQLKKMGMKEATDHDRYRAAATYSAVLCLDQEDGSAWAGRGNARLQRGDAEKALEDFDEAYRLNENAPPENNVPVYLGADAKLTTGDPDGATKDYVAFLNVTKESAALPKTPKFVEERLAV